jgi:hypothetical protein
MGVVEQLHVLRNNMLPIAWELEIVKNDQVVGDICDPKTPDNFHDSRKPILQCYKDIHNIMVTNTRVHNTTNIHNSFVGLMESCQEFQLKLQTIKGALKSPNVSSWKVAMDE